MKIRGQLNMFSAREEARPPLTVWVDPDEPDADNFSGGGGARLGIKQAYQDLGIERRAPGIAVNHWPEALAMYAANHPECRVFCEDIVKVDPVVASGGKRIAYAHFSPTCIFFSQAKGGPLGEEATKVRGLAWLAVSWAASIVRPRAMSLENVKPFMKWGPLHRHHSQGCSAELAAARGTVGKRGQVRPKCLRGCNYLRPIKARIGSLFNAFIARLGKYYRYVSYRVLKASNYGSPTSRERFFLIASDTPAEWPEPTHGPGRAQPWRTAAECIDFSIECPSIFERAKPLADKTLARIRAGLERFVFNVPRPFTVPRPFVVPTSYGDKGREDGRGASVDQPLSTICGNRDGHAVVSPIVVRTAHGDIDHSGKRRGQGAHSVELPLGAITAGGTDFAIATPYLVHRSNGERGATETTKAQSPRVYDAQQPLGTIVAQGQKHGLAMPVLVKNYSEREGGFAGGSRIDAPIGTITQRDHHSLAMLHLLKLRGTSDAHVAASSHPLNEPLPTISASGTHFAEVAAFLIRYNGTSGPEALGKPLSTIDTKDRFALITLTLDREVSERAMRVAAFLGYDAPIVLEIDGEQWVLVDIGFRMLTARELFLCQGFPPSWRIDLEFNGKPLTKTAQIKCVGNSVPPHLMRAVGRAAIRTIEYARAA
jgi:DNA (cytosine-5)-methyltransferase 1